MRRTLFGVGWFATIIVAFLFGRLSKNTSLEIPAGSPDGADRIAVLRGYLDAKKWEDRLAFVRRPDIVKPYMTNVYENFHPPIGYSIGPGESPGKSVLFPNVQFCSYAVTVPAQGTALEQSLQYMLVKTKKGWKIDWEATSMLNPISLREFQANPTNGDFTFRVTANHNDYYNYQYSDTKTTHYSFAVADESGVTLCGYARKNSEVGKVMFGLLKSGAGRYLTISARHTLESDVPGYSGTADHSLFEITGLISDEAISPPFDD